MFFLDIIAESNQYGDILQEAFIDSYYNLTLKSMFTLKFINQLLEPHSLPYEKNKDSETEKTKHFNQAGYNITYLFKVDDDCYVNPEAVLTYTRVVRRHPNAIIGHVLGPGSPVTRPTTICDDYNTTTSNQYIYKVLFKNCKYDSNIPQNTASTA